MSQDLSTRERIHDNRCYVFEIVYPWAPGCQGLRGGYPRKTWEEAFAEGKLHLENAERRGFSASLRVIDLRREL